MILKMCKHGKFHMFKTNKPTLFKMSVEVSGYVLELRNVDEH